MLLGEHPGGGGVALVVVLDLGDGGSGLLDGRECQQALPYRQHLAEAGLLGRNRPPARQIDGAAITEPAAAGSDVAALRYPELCLRAADEGGVIVRRARDLIRVEQAPAVLAQRTQ